MQITQAPRLLGCPENPKSARGKTFRWNGLQRIYRKVEIGKKIVIRVALRLFDEEKVS